VEAFVDALARGAVTGAVYGLIVFPFVFLWRSTRVFSFVQAPISIFAALVIIELGLGAATAAMVVAAGAVLGALAYYVAVVPVRRRGDDTHGTLVSTLALGLLIQAILLAVFGGLAQVADTPFAAHGFQLFTGTSFSYYSVALVVLCLALGGGASVFLNRSDLGVQWRAMGDDRVLARTRGVRVRAMETQCFAIGGAVSAAVGVLVASQVPIAAPEGLSLALKAFLVMGFVGLDRPWAGAVGGLGLGMTEAVLLNYVNAGLTNVLLVGALMLWLVGRGGVGAQAVREF
jgi:branched-chain amino acid transport system permease protein